MKPDTRTPELFDDLKMISILAQGGILVHLIELAAQRRVNGKMIIDPVKLEILRHEMFATTREHVRKWVGGVKEASYFENHACIEVSRILDMVSANNREN